MTTEPPRPVDLREVAHAVEVSRDERGIPTFDFKDVGMQLAEEYKALAASLDLPFFVTVQHCARDIYRVILSERPLEEEIRFRPIEQRTFVWAGRNRKGCTADTVLLTHDKYYTNVPMRPELLGIKRRKLKIVEVHYLATSDRFFDTLVEDIKVKCNLKTPTERDMDMVSRLLDTRVCEKVMGVNSILTSENQRITQDAEWHEKTADRRLYKKLETYLEDIESTGDVVKEGRFNFNLFPKNLTELMKYLIILVGVYFILGMILTYAFGIPIPFISGGGGGGSGDGGPYVPDPYNPNPAGLLLLFLGVMV